MTTLAARDPLPPIPDVSHLIGLTDGSQIHAISRDRAVRAVARDGGPGTTAAAVCGQVAVIARWWGGFTRSNLRVDQRETCPHCAWAVALHNDTTTDELDRITPQGVELDTLTRLLPDPLQAVKLCTGILDDRAHERGGDADYGRWAQLLGYVTAHRPVLLISEDCADDGCDHETEADCHVHAVAACAACSMHAGDWAGEWAGQYDVTVPAPCSVLTTLTGRHL